MEGKEELPGWPLRVCDSKMICAAFMNCPFFARNFTLKADKSAELMPLFSQWRETAWSCVLSVVFNAGFTSFLSSGAQWKGHPWKGKPGDLFLSMWSSTGDITCNMGIIVSALPVSQGKWDQVRKCAWKKLQFVKYSANKNSYSSYYKNVIIISNSKSRRDPSCAIT